ncbi:hypothetical protein TTRE_0000836101 [Trichuris trichiura]|uniref:Uncharacterized protein n=1 Tax=Trichuris trichiura TaxID=36087 RepID=A0A077ZJZ4_TRITR|nr:hypothetical protein TTRE_0000836101 [Trichuris trichiura]
MGNEGGIAEADVELYCEHLQALDDNFTRHFHDISSMLIPDWVINPLANCDDEQISVQEELLELQSNVELKARLSQGHQQLWLQEEIPELYPRCVNLSPRENLKKNKKDIAYLADLYYKFNVTNLQLQGSNLNLIKTKRVISAFEAKLQIFKGNLRAGEFYQFPLLAALKEEEHIGEQEVEFDILYFKIPQWAIDLMSNVGEEEMELRAAVENCPIAFPSSYLSECGISVVTELLSSKRSRLDIVNQGDLRLMRTKMQPNIKNCSYTKHTHHIEQCPSMCSRELAL